MIMPSAVDRYLVNALVAMSLLLDHTQPKHEEKLCSRLALAAELEPEALAEPDSLQKFFVCEPAYPCFFAVPYPNSLLQALTAAVSDKESCTWLTKRIR
jgi:hypothetical protein